MLDRIGLYGEREEQDKREGRGRPEVQPRAERGVGVGREEQDRLEEGGDQPWGASNTARPAAAVAQGSVSALLASARGRPT